MFNLHTQSDLNDIDLLIKIIVGKTSTIKSKSLTSKRAVLLVKSLTFLNINF